MTRGWLVVALACAGCNGLLGLDPTAEAPGGDRDRDGIADSEDNCPDVANTDQKDADGDGQGDACDACPMHPPTRDVDNDGVDDACDPCLLGPNHDEDGDGIFDACDVCPGMPDPDQLDGDGDGIGTPCDGVATNTERLTFDAFTTLGPYWTASMPWQLAADGDGVAPSGDGILVASDAEVGAIAITAGFALPTTLSPQAEVGVTIDASGDTDRCTVSCALGQCTLTAQAKGDTPENVVFAQPPRLVHVVYDRSLFTETSFSIRCSAVTATEAVSTTPILSSVQGVQPSVMSTSDVEVTYVDIIQ